MNEEKLRHPVDIRRVHVAIVSISIVNARGIISFHFLAKDPLDIQHYVLNESNEKGIGKPNTRKNISYKELSSL